jgi:hypothetical protein
MDWRLTLLHDAEAAQAAGIAGVKTCFELTAPRGKRTEK